MVGEALQNLGLFATGAAAAGLVARHGIERGSRLVERGIERFSEVGERGIDRSSEVVERGIEQFFEAQTARFEAELGGERVASSRLQEERAGVVVELYRRFVQFERDARALTAGGSSDPAADELVRAATESGDDFAQYYAENRIYFPPETCEVVDRLRDEMDDVVVDVRAVSSHSGRPDRGTDVEARRERRRSAAREEVPELKRTLENHCRELLGVDQDGGRLEDLDG